MIRILLADDHSKLREALRILLGGQPDIDVVGEVGNGQDAIRFCQESAVDLVLMDWDLPDINGIEATRSIISEFPHVAVLFFTSYSEEAYISEALAVGAKGYVAKTTRAVDLVDAIRLVAGGITPLILTPYEVQPPFKSPSDTPLITEG